MKFEKHQRWRLVGGAIVLFAVLTIGAVHGPDGTLTLRNEEDSTKGQPIIGDESKESTKQALFAFDTPILERNLKMKSKKASKTTTKSSKKKQKKYTTPDKWEGIFQRQAQSSRSSSKGTSWESIIFVPDCIPLPMHQQLSSSKGMMAKSDSTKGSHKKIKPSRRMRMMMMKKKKSTTSHEILTRRALGMMKKSQDLFVADSIRSKSSSSILSKRAKQGKGGKGSTHTPSYFCPETSQPTLDTFAPSETPSTLEPTPDSTVVIPTQAPTSSPMLTPSPTLSTEAPTAAPISIIPTVGPTMTPTGNPTVTPFEAPTQQPSFSPTTGATESNSPTAIPSPPTDSLAPTLTPTESNSPTGTTSRPSSSLAPTLAPTESSSPTGTTSPPTASFAPTIEETESTAPTLAPSESNSPTGSTSPPTESVVPTSEPTESFAPTSEPTESLVPTSAPTESNSPTAVTRSPTESFVPTAAGTTSSFPSTVPSNSPTQAPTVAGTVSVLPSVSPTSNPTFASDMPSFAPSLSAIPSASRSSVPTALPSEGPTLSVAPSVDPSLNAMFVYGLQPDCNVFDSTRFNICLDIASASGEVEEWWPFVIQAKERWEQIIVADPWGPWSDALLSNIPADFIATATPAGGVDDLYLAVYANDLTGGILAQASQSLVVPGFEIPSAYVEIDPDEIQNILDQNIFLDLMLHEIAHALGFGNLWGPSFYNLVSGSSYIGTNGLQAWRDLGCTGDLPIGPFSRHWQENCLGLELMTPTLTFNQNQILSDITLAAMEDLGYVVDRGQADPFTLANLGTCGSFCPEARRHLQEVTTRTSMDSDQPQLSQKAGQEMLNSAAKHFREQEQIMREKGLSMGAGDSVSYLYQENGYIYSRVIHRSQVTHLL